MPVVVDPDPMVVETLLAAMPARAPTASSPSDRAATRGSSAHSRRVRRRARPDADRSTRPSSPARCCAPTAPTISIVLAREAARHGDLLAAAMKAGVRDVVHHERHRRDHRARSTGPIELFVALRGPAGAMHIEQGHHRLLAQGRRRQDHDLGQPGARADARRAPARSAWSTSTSPSATSRSPCSCSRRHSIEQAIGSEDSIDVAMLDGLLTRHQDSLMVLAAPPHPDARERITPLLVSRILRTLRETFDFVVIDTGPGLRRAGRSPRSTRPTSASSSPPSTSRP